MALSGIRVIDLTRILAGPFCTLMLADMGAEVIKVESEKGGDPVRVQGSIKDGLSWYFAQFNRNKKSIVLDLYSEAGKADLARLLETADVLVENYRPDVLAKMGFSPERLRELNPRLIRASVNGYGSTGPYVDRPSFDFIAQAMSGFMSVNGLPDGDSMRAAPPMSDLREESRFLTNADRMENRDALVEIINAVTETRSVDHWIEVINKGGCPCGRVMNLGEVFSDPQVLSQEMVLEVDHPGHGMVKMTGFPVKLSETPPKLHRPAPKLGEHTEEVLGELSKR